MKRFGKTITALAVTGAMSVSLAPAASAQEGGKQSYEFETNSSRTAVGSSENGGVEGASSIDGFGSTGGNQEEEYKGSMAGLSSDETKGSNTEGDAETGSSLDELIAGLSSNSTDEAASTNGSADFNLGSSNDENKDSEGSAEGSANLGSSTDENKDGEGSAEGSANLGSSTDENKDGKGSAEGSAGLGSSTDEDKDGEGEAPAGSSVSPELALGIGLPAALLIGGVMWYLNQDGSTYVTDKNRTSSKPTKEEKKASDEMLKNNKSKVKAQAEAAAEQGVDADTRGMAAETGSNTVARGLAALVFAAVIGAVAFVARRRFSF